MRRPTPAGLRAGNTATISAAPAASSPAEATSSAEIPAPTDAGDQPAGETTAPAEAPAPAPAPGNTDEQPAAAPDEPAPAETSDTPAASEAPTVDAPDPLAMYDARVLVAFDEHEPNDIVSGTLDELGLLERDGKVDPHPDAVAYVRSLRA